MFFRNSNSTELSLHQYFFSVLIQLFWNMSRFLYFVNYFSLDICISTKWWGNICIFYSSNSEIWTNSRYSYSLSTKWERIYVHINWWFEYNFELQLGNMEFDGQSRGGMNVPVLPLDNNYCKAIISWIWEICK